MSAGTNVAPIKKPSNFEVELAEYEPQIAAALPAHIPVERFRRVVVTAINQNPDLYRADRRSLFTSCVRAAQDGLLPDGREAALVIFKTKNRQTGEWEQRVTYMPMIQGIIKRMRNSGDVAAVDAQLVHQKDEFTYRLGDDPKIEHKPALANRGNPIGAYAIIKLTNGEVLREVMGVDDIEKVRAVSRAKDNGPWVDWWGEMARKTVLRRCAKRAPVSSDLDELLRRNDEELFDQTRSQRTVEVAPPRPTRAQFEAGAASEEKPAAEPFVIVTGDGGELHFEAAKDAAQAMAEAITAASKVGADAVEGVWESNDFLISQLRERGDGQTADQIKALYVERVERLAKSGGKSGEGKADAAPEAEPPSPLKAKKAEWPARVDWLKKRLRGMGPQERADFLKADPDIAFIRGNRVGDWEAIKQLCDELADSERG